MGRPRHIGIDLDNTIVDYARSYVSICADLELGLNIADRDSVRSLLRNFNDDEEWQRFQSLLYTEGLSSADPALGLFEFFATCSRLKVHISIISHKTRTIPARFGGHNLRTLASDWLVKHDVVPRWVKPENVYFCETLNEKIEMIVSSGCEVFIDDLAEVLCDPGFPRGVTRFRFRPDASDTMAIVNFPMLTSWLISC